MEAVQSPQAVQETLEYTSTRQKKSYLLAKRAFDVISAGAALLVLSPVFLVVALLIKLDSEGPVIFKHNRIGKNGVGGLFLRVELIFLREHTVNHKRDKAQKEKNSHSAVYFLYAD